MMPVESVVTVRNDTMHIDTDLITYNPHLHDCTCCTQLVQPLSLPSSLYLVLYVDVSTLSQEDLSYLCMSMQSCNHQSCEAKLTREGGNECLMKSGGDTLGTAITTQVVWLLFKADTHNLSQSRPSLAHDCTCCTQLVQPFSLPSSLYLVLCVDEVSRWHMHLAQPSLLR